MEYSIKRGATVVLTARPTGRRVHKIMGENLINFTLELKQPVAFEIGDYITFDREDFYLNLLPVVNKSDSSGALVYTYELVFEARQYDLGKVAFLLPDNNNEYTKTDGFLVGDASFHLHHLVRNANRIQSGWEVGIVDSTELLNLNYTANKCLEVLARLAQEFNLEWHVNGQVIHLTKFGKDSGLKFEYGKGKGLYEITRRNVDSTNIVTRVYGEGGTKNIPSDYRNFSTRLRLPEGTNYLEKNTAKYGIIEHSLPPFEEIYPKRIGTVTNVIDAYTFEDTSIDFDVNDYLLPGVTVKIHFQTGPLGGYEFEIASFSNQTFVINQNQDEKAYEIPSELIHATRGDKYILSGLNMPDEYKTLAELELKAKLQEYIDINSIPRVIYGVTPDPLDFKRKGIKINLGDRANVVDAPLEADINPRIIGYEQDLHELTTYPSLELAENVPVPVLARQYADQKRILEFFRSPLVKKITSTTTPVTTSQEPVRREIVFNPGFNSYHEYKIPNESGVLEPKPVYWKTNGVVYFSGKFLQINNPTAPFSPFDMPLGFRPWYDAEASCPIKITVGLFNPIELWGTLKVLQNGQVFITGTWPNGEKIEPQQISAFDLSGCQFFTGMGG